MGRRRCPAGPHQPRSPKALGALRRCRDIVPLASYAQAPIEQLLYDWKWLALFFNRINTAMGKQPLYPFEIPPPVIGKLGFVHKVIRESALTAESLHPA